MRIELRVWRDERDEGFTQFPLLVVLLGALAHDAVAKRLLSVMVIGLVDAIAHVRARLGTQTEHMGDAVDEVIRDERASLEEFED